jgi:hypothetical protein
MDVIRLSVKPVPYRWRRTFPLKVPTPDFWTKRR